MQMKLVLEGGLGRIILIIRLALPLFIQIIQHMIRLLLLKKEKVLQVLMLILTLLMVVPVDMVVVLLPMVVVVLSGGTAPFPTSESWWRTGTNMKLQFGRDRLVTGSQVDSGGTGIGAPVGAPITGFLTPEMLTNRSVWMR